MAYISNIGSEGNTHLTFNDKENALAVVNALLADNEQGEYGQYAVMISREESLWRLDIADTFNDDYIVFGSEYYVDKYYAHEEDEDDAET